MEIRLDRLFTARGAWNGGFYELAIELGPRSTERLAREVLWASDGLDGCFLFREEEPQDQERISPGACSPEGHLYGIATLPNGTRVACSTVAIREDAGTDWLALNLPMGSLQNAYPV